ncbi:MAG: electron transport complex subunit E [Pseudomonadales bacterium]|nr:electron transport complex subunit E [Pseudomonadales bacterium]
MKPGQIAIEGLWRDNPALVQLLGLCPLLAVSNTVVNSLGLGLATLAVLVLSNLVISSLRGFLDDATRLPAQIMVIATFVTCADLVLQAFFFDVHHRIGLFVALIVTNCTLLGRAESFARRNTVSMAMLDGAMMGIGFLLVILVMGAIRELLGQGTLFANMDLLLGSMAADWTLTVADRGFLLTILPPGAFLVLGCLIALKNYIEGRALRQDSLIPVKQQ